MMAQLWTHHKELTDGVGKCSVPMWSGGCPAGFCDRDAYGKKQSDEKYDGYVPALACSVHGGPSNPKGRAMIADTQDCFFVAAQCRCSAADIPGCTRHDPECGSGRCERCLVNDLLNTDGLCFRCWQLKRWHDVGDTQ